MYLKSIEGTVLFEGRFHSIKQGLEMAVADKVDLKGVNLRRANLKNALLDGAKLEKACLWGACLTNADMSNCALSGADFRAANMKDACLAEADCSKVDFSGAYFSRTIIRHADLSGTRYSCPSIFTLDLNEANSLKRSVYSHRGEVDCDISRAPVIVRGLEKPLVFMDDKILIGTQLRNIDQKEMIYNFILAQTSLAKMMPKQSDSR
jgi:uncharacterized protein YjbI with pentapeptide repeats